MEIIKTPKSAWNYRFKLRVAEERKVKRSAFIGRQIPTEVMEENGPRPEVGAAKSR